jgi:cell division protein FtsN
VQLPVKRDTTPQPQVDNSSTKMPSDGALSPATDPPLSFYKTLPSGQKSNTLGSGINTKEDKPAKLPLQAAMPTNVSKPTSSQPDETAQAQPLKAAPTKPANASHPEVSGHTVQVASFSLRSEAETLRSKLTAKGYNVGIVESHLGDKGTWYRVRVGKHLDPEAAKELAVKLGKGAIAIPEKD